MVLENSIYKGEKMKLKLLDLFSGIGGFSLGLESTGFFETIAFVEKDKFCHEVLKKNFPNITIESEVRNVKGNKYKADIITGGFPCQPFSVAGKRKGTDDDRYLWDETIRVIRECKPRWFIGENVEGIINIQNGMVLRQVCDDLEKEDFEVQCLVIPASGIGAWHQRKRVWILAYSKHNGSHRQERNETIESSNQSKEWVSVGDNKDIPNTNCEGSQRYGVSTNMETKQRQVSSKNSIEEQQTWWQTQSSLCGIPNGISYELDKDRKNRIKALGNSIVPLIARQLGLAIMKAEQE
jgi:DNA (cytosine-5)-methyltransferase 1